MLKKFRVRNFKNFKDWFELDLSDMKNYEFNQQCVENGIVSTAVIYGPNGCGKSNLRLALFDIHTHLTDYKIIEKYKSNYKNAFLEDEHVEFTYLFQFGKHEVEYSYGKTSVEKFSYETLKADGEILVALKRENGNKAIVNLMGAENLNRDMKDSDISVIKYVKNNTVLDTEDSNNKLFEAFYSFINNMVMSSTIESYGSVIVDPASFSEILVEYNKLKEFENFLNASEVKCKLKFSKRDGRELLHFVFGDKKVEFSQIASTGTMALFHFFLNTILMEERIDYLKKNSSGDNNQKALIFIDEFDAFYHQKVAKNIVRSMRDMNAQVIFTTHNTSIMSNDLLRPDCYFLMDEEKIKPMFSFTEKELRKAHNIEKMYRAGVFDE